MSRNETDALIEQNNAELEALRRDMAERQRRDKSAEMLQWAKARNQGRAERQPEPSRTTEVKPMTQPTGEAYWDSWRSFVRKTMRADIRHSEVLMADCVGKVLGGVEKKHKEALDELRTELAVVKNELSQLRAESKVSRALDDVQVRLQQIEQRSARPPLRTIGTALTA